MLQDLSLILSYLMLRIVPPWFSITRRGLLNIRMLWICGYLSNVSSVIRIKQNSSTLYLPEHCKARVCMCGKFLKSTTSVGSSWEIEATVEPSDASQLHLIVVLVLQSASRDLLRNQVLRTTVGLWLRPGLLHLFGAMRQQETGSEWISMLHRDHYHY